MVENRNLFVHLGNNLLGIEKKKWLEEYMKEEQKIKREM